MWRHVALPVISGSMQELLRRRHRLRCNRLPTATRSNHVACDAVLSYKPGLWHFAMLTPVCRRAAYRRVVGGDGLWGHRYK